MVIMVAQFYLHRAVCAMGYGTWLYLGVPHLHRALRKRRQAFCTEGVRTLYRFVLHASTEAGAADCVSLCAICADRSWCSD